MYGVYAYPIYESSARVHTESALDMEVRVRVQAASRAVAQGANTPDYARILELCDMLNRDGSGRAAAVTANTLYGIMKNESSYLVLFLTLHVLELCVMNCGTVFHDRISNEQFVKALFHLGGKYLKKKEHFRIEDANSAKGGDQISGNHKALKFSVRMKAMALVQSLALGFQKDQRHAIFYTEYHKLVAKGIIFPVHKPTDFAPIATPAPHRNAPATPSYAAPMSSPPANQPGSGVSAETNFAVIRTNITLLNEMLRNNEDIRGNDLVQELATGARTVKGQMQTWIAANLESPNLGTALDLNDFIEATLKLHQQRLSGGSGGGGPRINEDGKARNHLGAPVSHVVGGRVRADSSSSSDDSSSDDFQLISNRHGAPPPVLQPISPSSGPAPSSQLNVQMVAHAPYQASTPAYNPYQPPPSAVLSSVPPPQMPPNLSPPPPGYAWVFPPYNPSVPQPQQPMLIPYPMSHPNPATYASVSSAPLVPASAPATPVNASPFAPVASPVSASAYSAASSPFIVPAHQSAAPAPAPAAANPFISPPQSPAYGRADSSGPPLSMGAPAPVPGAQPVYVLWPPRQANTNNPASPPAPGAPQASANPFETR